MSQTLPSSIAGFTLIPIHYSPEATHIIYAHTHVNPKKHKGRGKEVLPEGRTLFLVNVPPDATEREISLLFKNSGTIEKVIFNGDVGAPEEQHESEDESESEGNGNGGESEEAGEDIEAEGQPKKKRKVAQDTKQGPPRIISLPTQSTRALRRTGRSAHVVFLDESSLSRALSTPLKPRQWPRDASAPSGFAHYTASYDSLRPALDIVKAHADSWMEHFEYEQAKKRQQSKYKKGEAIVDEDGFTLVTRGGAYGQSVGGGVRVASKRFHDGGGAGKRSRKNKKEPKEKEAFYAFQIHENKRKEIMDLKKRWEEDKAKVEKLKESRRFKPY